MPFVDPHDEVWVNNHIQAFPIEFQKPLMRDYENAPTRFDANTQLRKTSEAVGKAIGFGDSVRQAYRFEVEWDDQKIQHKAELAVKSCECLVRNLKTLGLSHIYREIIRFIEAKNIRPHLVSNQTVDRIGSVNETETDRKLIQSVINRATSVDWWKRKFARLQQQQIEICARHLNLVNKHQGIYASDLTVSNFLSRASFSQRMLEETIATNEEGYSASLAELSALNVSNPKIRKAELMVRARGFEEYADSAGHSALFITMTTPSKYHRSFSKSGDKNPKWNHSTPQDAQKYLNKVFARIRAQLKRDGINPYGFRVVEPHHDGTPHWHLLLFIPTEFQSRMTEIFTEYCLAEDGDEKGAAENRIQVKTINPEEGTATGYIAKYVSKNIDGEGIDEDSYGKEAKNSAVRVRAWASCWGIRQFQQIGGIGVTQWRELRRLKTIKQKGMDWLEEIRQAADTSNWGAYMKLMGGVFCPRKNQALRPYYDFKMNKETGELSKSRYGDSFVVQLRGITGKGVELITRTHEWRVERGRRPNCSYLDLCK